MVNFWEVVRRGELGPKVAERDFDMKHVALKIIELQREHCIKFDAKVIIPSDNGLADSVWQAAIELLVHSGVYYTQTGRVIKFTEDEIKDELMHTPDEFIMGAGEDTVKMMHRDVEDARYPLVFGGPHGAPVSEDMLVKLNQAYAQERLIDVLNHSGHLEWIEGVEIRADSPLEVQAAWVAAERTREALRRAGRPNMPVAAWSAGVTGVNEVVASNEERGMRRFDPRMVYWLPELKVDWANISKTAHYHAFGCPVYAVSLPLTGGLGGDPAGTAILTAAYHIANRLVFKATIAHLGPQHVKFGQQSNPHSLYMGSLAGQAISRNSNLLRVTSITVSGRPPSKQNLYEGAAGMLAWTVSGSDLNCGPRPARTLYYNHVSPLAARFCAEIGRAAAGMKRDTARDIVKELLKKYQDYIDFEKAAKGSPFETFYDTNTLIPKRDYLQAYNEVKRELTDLGLNFKTSCCCAGESEGLRDPTIQK
ncbi:MAG TPA: monomethylamine:corrinoid methyltransferase [Candidatus Bathyarchaeia archaeon]|nr:monomethylamine:corrinoid methyltransferase [Candidatus Bathyarchaeia archaeon]